MRTRLLAEGYEVTLCADGRRGLEEHLAMSPDLVVLDLGLPDLDGLEVCRRMQAERPTPVLMLTARDDEADVVLGLEVGADDYLTKPFSPRELTARVRVSIRRSAAFVGGGWVTRCTPGGRRCRGRRCSTHGVPSGRDAPAHARPSSTLSPSSPWIRASSTLGSRCLPRCGAIAMAVGARTVDSHVRAIRRKLGDDVIRTVHGVGYAFGIGS